MVAGSDGAAHERKVESRRERKVIEVQILKGVKEG